MWRPQRAIWRIGASDPPPLSSCKKLERSLKVISQRQFFFNPDLIEADPPSSHTHATAAYSDGKWIGPVECEFLLKNLVRILPKSP
jgi:hypothetical protein